MSPPIQPPLQNPAKPDLRSLLDAISLEIRKQVNCARPGIVQDFDSTKGTATVLIAQQQIASVSPDGVQTLSPFPLLVSVPVFILGGGGFSATFPIAEGDECLVVFADREIDNWLETGGANTVPTTPRVHDMADGMCFVGFRSYPRAPANYSATSARLTNDAGTSYLELAPNDTVRVHAGKVYEWDVNGYGQKIEWTGGPNYTITNYTIGATITTVNANINPPGPP